MNLPFANRVTHAFLAILLYSSIKVWRSPISSVSDRLPRSPLVDVHVALLRTPLDVLLTGRDKRAEEAAEGLGCRSGVTASRDALMLVASEGRGAQRQKQSLDTFCAEVFAMRINQTNIEVIGVFFFLFLENSQSRSGASRRLFGTRDECPIIKLDEADDTNGSQGCLLPTGGRAGAGDTTLRTGLFELSKSSKLNWNRY